LRKGAIACFGWSEPGRGFARGTAGGLLGVQPAHFPMRAKKIISFCNFLATGAGHCRIGKRRRNQAVRRARDFLEGLKKNKLTV
jgi:hypothetical protein